MNNNSAIIAVLILIVVVLAGWFAYKQGYFMGTSNDQPGAEINLPNTGGDTPPMGGGGY